MYISTARGDNLNSSCSFPLAGLCLFALHCLIHTHSCSFPLAVLNKFSYLISNHYRDSHDLCPASAGKVSHGARVVGRADDVRHASDTLLDATASRPIRQTLCITAVKDRNLHQFKWEFWLSLCQEPVFVVVTTWWTHAVKPVQGRRVPLNQRV